MPNLLLALYFPAPVLKLLSDALSENLERDFEFCERDSVALCVDLITPDSYDWVRPADGFG